MVNIEIYSFILENIDIILSFGILLVGIILGLDSSLVNNVDLYERKYTIMIYTTFLILVNINLLYNSMLSIKFIVFIMSLTIALVGINSNLKISYLEKELSDLHLVIFLGWSWFFKSNSYIFYIMLIIYFIICKTINNEFFITTTGNIFIIFFMIYHLIKNLKDRFSYKSFEEIYKELNSIEGDINKIKYSLKEESYEKLLDILGFLLYVEDRDFFSRKKYTYSIIKVIERKNKKLKYNKTNSLDDSSNDNSFIHSLNITNIFRGFSTLEQQVIRTISMGPYTYNYLIRRKLFIESILLKAFTRSILNRKYRNKNLIQNKIKTFKKFLTNNKSIEEEIKSRQKKKKLINLNIKLKFLIYYYINISNCPETIDCMIQSINKESAQSVDSLNKKKIKYEKSLLRHDLISSIDESFNMIK